MLPTDLNCRRHNESSKAEEDGRCACGSLQFRRVPGGIEIKCRHCKRVNLVKT